MDNLEISPKKVKLDQEQSTENVDFGDEDTDQVEGVEAGSEKTLVIEPGIRLDVGVTELIDKSRSYIQALIEEGNILVNGERKKANYKIRFNDTIKVTLPPLRELDVIPEPIPLDILYEDQDLIVVNKPQGMVVHPAPGSWSGTLVNALLHHCNTLSGINGVLRPGIVHRIDKDTSGVLVVAKSDQAHVGLAQQIKDHSMERRYLAIVHGVVEEPSGTIDAPIGRDPVERKRMAVVFKGSKAAVTHYKVLKRFVDFTYLEARLETGRTHQIRVHMAYLKHPVLGDPLYGPRKNLLNCKGQMLHAARLGFNHPCTGRYMEFEAPVPKQYDEILTKLQEHND